MTYFSGWSESNFYNVLYLSWGSAVQTMLCEVPAVICCICFPSRPTTFVGDVTGLVLWLKPHCPMALLPQAYTSFSEQINIRVEDMIECLFNRLWVLQHMRKIALEPLQSWSTEEVNIDYTWFGKICNLAINDILLMVKSKKIQWQIFIYATT